MKSFSLGRSSQLGYELIRESAANAYGFARSWAQGATPETARETALDAATVALGVSDGKRMCLGLIVEIRQGEIGMVKHLNPETIGAPLTLSAESFERMWCLLGQNLNVLAALLCDRATFEGLVDAENKLGYLAAVGHAQPYFYRVKVQ